MAIKNIVFDLGGVVLDIDFNLTVEGFRKMGHPQFDQVFSKAIQNPEIQLFEKGLIPESDFRNFIRKELESDISDAEIDQAWNALLLHFDAERIAYIKALQNDYNIYLLSNTNSIHQKQFYQNFQNLFNHHMDDLFIQAFYSHEMNQRKPDIEIYETVLQTANLNPEETLFLDDSPQNLPPANQVGIQTIHITKENPITVALPSILT